MGKQAKPFAPNPSNIGNIADSIILSTAPFNAPTTCSPVLTAFKAKAAAFDELLKLLLLYVS